MLPVVVGLLVQAGYELWSPPQLLGRVDGWGRVGG